MTNIVSPRSSQQLRQIAVPKCAADNIQITVTPYSQILKVYKSEFSKVCDLYSHTLGSVVVCAVAREISQFYMHSHAFSRERYEAGT